MEANNAYCGRCWTSYDLTLVEGSAGERMHLCHSCREHYGYISMDEYLDLISVEA